MYRGTIKRISDQQGLAIDFLILQLKRAIARQEHLDFSYVMERDASASLKQTQDALTLWNTCAQFLRLAEPGKDFLTQQLSDEGSFGYKVVDTLLSAGGYASMRHCLVSIR